MRPWNKRVHREAIQDMAKLERENKQLKIIVDELTARLEFYKEFENKVKEVVNKNETKH